MNMNDTMRQIRMEKQVHFPDWKAKVDKILLHKTGESSDGLPDFPYFDMMDKGMTAEQAARHIIEQLNEET